MELEKTTQMLASNFERLTQTSQKQGVLFWPALLVLGSLTIPVSVACAGLEGVFVWSLLPVGFALVVFLTVILRTKETSWISERTMLEGMRQGLYGTRDQALVNAPAGKAIEEVQARVAAIPEEAADKYTGGGTH